MQKIAKFLMSATLIALIPSLSIKQADAAILGFERIYDSPEKFEYNFFFDNTFDLGSTISVGNNWTITVTEVFAVPTGMNTQAMQSIQLSSIKHVITPHGDGQNILPDIIFPRFMQTTGGGQKQHESHFDIGMGEYVNLLLNSELPRPENSNTCPNCKLDAVWRLNVKLVHTPEPSSMIGILTFAVLGASAVLKSKRKQTIRIN